MVGASIPGWRLKGQGRGRLGMTYSWGRSGRMKSFANLRKQKSRRRERYEDKIIREKKKKMKMLIMNRFSNDISNSPPIIISTGNGLLDDENILCQVLSRLPVKSLMRFKSVCKRWRSLIQLDSHFHHSHLTWSKTRPGLLILHFMRDQWRLLSADLVEDRAVVHTIRTIMTSSLGLLHDQVQVMLLNGLICLMDGISYSARIYNPSTSEATPWIKSTIFSTEKKKECGVEVYKDPDCVFGFDPATKQHKVICLWRIYRIGPKYETTKIPVACEILTVGHNNSWRRINEVPPYITRLPSLCTNRFYANGSIYWSNYNEVDALLGKKWNENRDPEVIVAFDVGSEKFRVIPIPNFILDQPMDCDEHLGPTVQLLEVDGRVAVLRRMTGYTVKMWIFDDDHDNEKGNPTTTTTITSTSNGNWTDEMTITLPFRWGGSVSLYFGAVPGTNKIIIKSHENSLRLMKYTSLYYYNWKEKTCTKFEINGISSIPERSSTALYTNFIGSILPLHN